jgi:hypothetical protein
MAIEDPDVRRRFEEGAVEGRISCDRCFEIADELGIEKSEIAETLTEMGIKIIRCQLGCFR